MYLQTADELRRIRITLIFLTIVLLFTGGGNRNVTVEHNDDDHVISSYHKNLVPLGNGYFGFFSGDMQLDNNMKVYYYNEKENKMVLKREVNLDTVETEE